jgi:APA family basic amino acid/polyamine antiporter
VSSPGELRRQLGLGSAAALVVGEVIGVGIFLTPAGMAKAISSPTWLLAVWLVMGGVTLAGALCLGELAARFPSAGGLYVYLREAYGSGTAFLWGWMSLLVIDPGLTALLATGLASYLGYVAELSAVGSKVVALGTVLVLAAINIAGLRPGAGLLRGLTLLKLSFLAFIVCWGFGKGLGDWSNFTPLVARPAGSGPLAGALAAGMVSAFFSFAGWWDVSKMAGEINNPGRTLPRALMLAVATVTIAYIAVSAVFLYLVPVAEVTSDEAFAAQAGEALFGRAGGVTFAIVVAVAVLGSLASFVLSAPRVYYAMARDGLFFPGIAAVHPRLGTPVRAIALQAILTCVLALSGTFNEILATFFFVVVAFLALAIASLFVLRRRPAEPPAYLTPLYPVTPLLFLIPVTVLLVLLALSNTARVFLGLVVVALGIPVYYLLFRRRMLLAEKSRADQSVREMAPERTGAPP